MAGPVRILIVDDDRFVRAFLRDALEQAPGKYQLSEAEDGEAALEQIKVSAPELVLLDLFMPRRSGIDTLNEIRARSPSTRVVIISSLEAPALIDQAKQAGASDFIVKPFHPLEVLGAVEKALGGP